MTCRRCAAALPEGAAFCPECGLAVVAASPIWGPPTPATSAPQTAAPQAADSMRVDPSPSPGRQRGLLVGTAALLVIGAGVVTFWQLRPPATNATTQTPTPVVATSAQSPEQPLFTPSPSSPSPPPVEVTTPTTSPLTPEEEAALHLEARAGADASSIDFEGQWIAQLASKYVGIRDPLQTAANGTDTFYAADIIAESDALATRVDGVRVALLNSLTYGSRSDHNGEPLWVTVALSPDFTSRDVVRSWCAAQFPELTGDDLANQCVPRQLNP